MQEQRDIIGVAYGFEHRQKRPEARCAEAVVVGVARDEMRQTVREQVQGGVLCTAAEQTEQAALVQLQQHPAGKAPCGKAGVALHGVIALRMGHNGHKAALRDGLERPQQHGAGQSKVKFYEQIP